jgi:DNA-binding CsgD family transcriptional regulator
MRRSTQLSIDDVSAIFRLVGECREMWADARAWQEHLVRGACRLTGTATGQFNEQRLAADLSRTDILDETFAGDWRDERSRAHVVRMYADHTNRATFFRRCMRLAGCALAAGHATALRRQLRPDAEWYRSLLFNEYRRPAHMDDAILSFAHAPSRGTIVMLAVNHDVSDHAPTLGAAAALSLLTRQIAPLIGTALATTAQRGTHDLSPRLRQTLDRLLTGDSEKEIASKLALHRTTVHQYVGMLYEHFHVESRGELMAYFISRRPSCSAASTSLA